jgi:hypothetical protein
LRVVYDSSSVSAPVELDEADFRVLLWTLKFKVQGYLFSPISTSKLVHNVIQNYYITEGMTTNDSTDLRIGEVSEAVLQGLTYANPVPEAGTPIDDEIRAMYAYEHFERAPNTSYVFNDDMVWIQDDDDLPVDDDIYRHIRE